MLWELLARGRTFIKGRRVSEKKWHKIENLKCEWRCSKFFLKLLRGTPVWSGVLLDTSASWLPLAIATITHRKLTHINTYYSINTYFLSSSVIYKDFPAGSDGKVSLQRRRPGFEPWVWKIPWKRKWQSTPVLLPGKSHGQRSLVGYSLWGCKESDTTEQLHFLWFKQCPGLCKPNSCKQTSKAPDFTELTLW